MRVWVIAAMVVCFYATLGVEPTATSEEIRAAFRERAKVLHPDAGGDPEAFKLLAAAYEVLRDPPARSAYDRSRSRDASWEGGATAASDFTWSQWAQAAESAERRAARAEALRRQEAETVAWWVSQKADAEENKTRFRATLARASAAADARREQVLRPLWQTRRGLVWADAAVLLTLAGSLAYAFRWTPQRAPVDAPEGSGGLEAA